MTTVRVGVGTLTTGDGRTPRIEHVPAGIRKGVKDRRVWMALTASEAALVERLRARR